MPVLSPPVPERFGSQFTVRFLSHTVFFSTFNRHVLFIFCKNHCRVVLVQPGAWSCIPEIMGFMMGVANFRTPPHKTGWWFGTI